MIVNSETVRYLREKRAWTQEQFAEIAGISVRTVQRMERGEPISFATIKAVAKALGVEIDKLKSRVQPNSKNSKKDIFLSRIMSGNELLLAIIGAEFFQFSHDDLDTEDEVQLVSGFFDFVQDCDVLDELSAGARVRVAFELDQMIQELHNAGFWVFGKVLVKKYRVNVGDDSKILPGRTAIIRVVRKDSPEIIKKHTPTPSLFASS